MTEFLPDFKEIIQHQLDKNLTVMLFAVFTGCLMSSCLSSSISEKKAYARLPHTVLGFFLPLLYPLLITFALPKKGVKKEPVKKTDDTTTSELPMMDLNEKYFKSIYLDPNGNPTGPYMIDMESNVVKADCIVEVHPDFIVIENINNSGKRQRMRSPYNKMTSCTLLEEERYSESPGETVDSGVGLAWFDSEDPEMQQAIHEAQKNFHKFKEELSLEARRIVPAMEACGIKAFFQAKNGGGEHMFVQDVRVEGSTVSGTLASEPQVLDHLNAGEDVSFSLDRVSDWFYVIDGQGHAGYTFKLIMSRMSEKEVQQAAQHPPLMWFV